VGQKGSKEKLSSLFRSGCNLCCGREREKKGVRWMRAVKGRLAQHCPGWWCFRCGIKPPSGLPQFLRREKR